MLGTSIKLYNRIKFLFISFSLLIPKFSVFGGYLLYSEKFINQNNKGVYGPIPTLNLSDISWGLNYSLSSLTDTDDYAKVVNEALEFQDLDGVVSFESPFLDSSGFSNFYVQFELSETGDLEGTDTIEGFYTLDTGESYHSIGSRSGNFSDDNISDSIIVYIDEANSIGLKIDAINNASGEYLRVDNLTIQTETLNGATIEVNASNLNHFSENFEIYSGGFYLADQIEYDLNLTLSPNYTEIYRQDFSGENGKGKSGSNTDLSGVDWNISAPESLSDQYDYLKVNNLNGNELFEFRDLGGNTGTWNSPEMNASSFQKLRIIGSLSEVGVMETNDQMLVEYSVDEGNTYSTLFSQMGDFGSYELNRSISHTDHLLLKISAKNSADDEKHRFDDLIVQGLAPVTMGDRDGGTSVFSGAMNLNRPVELTAAENGKVTMSGVIAGTEDITKQGTGIIALTNPSNTHTGNFLIEQGKLEIGSGVSVGTLTGRGNKKTVVGGDGTVNHLTIGSALGEVKFLSPGSGHASSMNPGSSLNQFISNNENGTMGDTSDDASASIGSLHVNSLGLADGGVYDWEIKDFSGSNPETDWDVLSFTNLSLGPSNSSFVINILPVSSSDGTAGAPDNSENLWLKNGSSFKFLDGPDGGAGINWGEWSQDTINNFFTFEIEDFSYHTNFYYNDWNVSYLNGDFYLNYTAVPQHSTYGMSAIPSLIPIALNFKTLMLFVGKKLLRRKNMINQKGAMRVPDRINAWEGITPRRMNDELA
jgi:autotransporter-associated beta strand protein